MELNGGQSRGKKFLEAPKYFKLGWKFTLKQDNKPKHTARVTMVRHQACSSVWVTRLIFFGGKVKVIFSDVIVLYVHVFSFSLFLQVKKQIPGVFLFHSLSPICLFLFHLSVESEINFIYRNKEASVRADHFGSKPICLIPSNPKLDALQSLTVLKIFLQMEKSHTTVPARGKISYLQKLQHIYTHVHEYKYSQLKTNCIKVFFPLHIDKVRGYGESCNAPFVKEKLLGFFLAQVWLLYRQDTLNTHINKKNNKTLNFWIVQKIQHLKACVLFLKHYIARETDFNFFFRWHTQYVVH